MPTAGSGSASAAISYGWPVVADVVQKLNLTAPDGVTPEMEADIENLLEAIIAEFQSPPAAGGHRGGVAFSSSAGTVGGTGRSFTPTFEVRHFDGNGYPQLRVDDIVPDTEFTVKVYDARLVDVRLREPVKPYVGYNVLIRPQGAGSILGSSYATPGIFPMGLQNISVEATWGYSASIPKDIWEAIRCEASYRSLVQGVIPLAGVGEEVRIGNFGINTSVGILVWAQSSPVSIYHQQYTSAIERYRDRGAWRRVYVAKRMS